MYDAFLIEKNAKYSKKRGAFWFFDTKTHPLHCCRHKKSCEWYILEAKAVLHQMRHNFLFWKLCNHILSHAALSWHQEYTSHMISCSFVIEVKSHRMVTGHDHFWKSVYWQLWQSRVTEQGILILLTERKLYPIWCRMVLESIIYQLYDSCLFPYWEKCKTLKKMQCYSIFRW